MNTLKAIIAINCVTLLFGCSSADRSSLCAGSSIGGASLGVLNPFAAPCAVSNIVDLSVNIANSGSKNDQTSQTKTFQPTKEVMKDFGDNPDVMQFVLDSQDKYKAGDFGTASDDQKIQLIGSYKSPQLGKTITIKDTGKSFEVAYEQ